MLTPHNENKLDKPLRSKKKRSAVFIVIVASIAVHVLGLGGLAAIKIIEVLQPAPEFEAPPLQAVVTPPPPPPPPPPTTKRMQRSLPRPQPLAAQNPQNMSVPSINMQDSDLSLSGGRGIGGGLGELGGGMLDRVDFKFFGGGLTEVQDMMFIVDISGSMIVDKRGIDGYKLVVDELIKTLESIKGQGSFSLVAFSGQAYLYSRRFVLATDSSVEDAEKWLLSYNPANALAPNDDPNKFKGWNTYKRGRHSGTSVHLALDAAFKVKPRTIYLLSDGEPTGRKVSEIYEQVKELQKNGQVPINTISYKSNKGQTFLKKLAKDNRGEFRAVN